MATNAPIGAMISGHYIPVTTSSKVYGQIKTTEQNNAGQVNFKTNTSKKAEVHEKKKKYLTAKYGGQQMMLIRKRLAAEDWLDDRLRSFYNCEDDGDYNCEIDFDDLLDYDTEDERQQFLREKLSNAKQPQAHLNRLIEEIMQKSDTL